MSIITEQTADMVTARLSADKALELSADPHRARCVELECLLQAKDTYISHLEAERDAQARSHAVRLAELQHSCHNKVCQLQQLHREQLSAAQLSAAAGLAAAAAPAASAVVTDKIKKLSALFEAEQAKCAAECTMLQDRLLGAEQQQESLRALLQASSSQAQHSQQQERQLRQELADSKAALADLASSQITLQGHCSTLESQLADMQSNSTTRPSQQPGTVQADCVAVFRLLEQQLVSLSDNLKFKEQQVAALQQTVQQQCDERTLMQIRCMQSGAGHGPGNDGTTAASCSVSVSGPTEHLRTSDDASQSVSSTLPTQEVAVGKGPDRASTSAQSKSKLNRLASASEQQHGKSGLLGRIMATSSTTGNLKFA